MKTKKWRKPVLVILSRSQPEEAVLANCKTGGQTYAGQANCANTPASCFSQKSS